MNSVSGTVKTTTFQEIDVDWYMEADDIILKKAIASKSTLTKNNNQTYPCRFPYDLIL